MNGELQPARVRVPCSTSNLGAGFDCIGLALDRHLEARFAPGDESLTLQRAGTLASLATPIGDDLLVAAFRERMSELGRPAARGTIHVTSRIPVARGLGSSSAALICGYALADAVSGVRFDALSAMNYGALLEGHGDNCGPCALGGLIAATQIGAETDPSNAGFHAFRLRLSTDLGFAFAAPPIDIRTKDAREALPKTVAFGTAVHSIHAMSALIEGLAHGDADLLRIGFSDQLHVPYRLRLIPGAEAVMAAAVSAGAYAVTISGSGSGLFAVGARGNEAKIAETMSAAFAHAMRARSIDAAGVDAFPVAPDLIGTQILTP